MEGGYARKTTSFGVAEGGDEGGGGGVQAENTNYFVSWCVLYEYSSFNHFPNIHDLQKVRIRKFHVNSHTYYY